MDGMLVLAPVLVPRLLLFAFYPGMCVPQTRNAQLINYLTRAIAKAKPQKRPSFGRSNSRDIGRGRALTERTTLDRSTIIDLFRQAGTSRRARVKSRDADSPLEGGGFEPSVPARSRTVGRHHNRPTACSSPTCRATRSHGLEYLLLLRLLDARRVR